MDSVIELQRQTHEEIERFERSIATVLSRPPTTRQNQVKNEHRVANILDRITDRASNLSDIYQDSDGTRHAESLALSTQGLDTFYSRLKTLKDYHNKYPGEPVDGFDLELSGLLGEQEDLQDVEEYEDPVSLMFSGEEKYGRYLDLYSNHSQYNNLKGIPRRVPYAQYLDILASVTEGGAVHKELDKPVKQSKDYENYITNLYNYALSFTKRTQPLVDTDTHQALAITEFEKLWDENQITGWEDPNHADIAMNGSEGVWCPACQKLYAKQTVYDAHLKSKKHIKAAEKSLGGTPAEPQNDGSAAHSTKPRRPKIFKAAQTTHVLAQLLIPLVPTISETKSNIERRFALTAREREEEAEADAPSAPVPSSNGAAANAPAIDEDEEEERIYNPLKLPLGWDGKPIPYWLYKLHGLGVEYRCEICSDAVYMGRKNFDRHFQESRHAFGMRSLGLPNTKHFHEITRIEDALSLAEKLKQEGRQEIFQNETMEEMEDDEGNVYNRKTYEDLKKQGLI